MLSRKATVAGAAVAALALLTTTSCSSGGSSGSGDQAGPTNSGTVTWYSNTFGPTQHDVRKTLIAAFEKAYPKITVKLQTAPSDSDVMRSTLTTQIAGGSATPDVYNGDVVWPAQFGKKGLAEPLSDHLPQSFFSRFDPNQIKAMTYKGKVMAAPLFTDESFLFYRKDLLKKAHLPVPRTWEQLKSEAQKLQDQGLVKYGFAGQFASYEGLTCNWMEYLADAGGSVLNKKGDKSALDSPQSLKALTFMKSLISDGVAPKAITSFQEKQSESLFTSGQVAFLRNWTYAYADATDPKASKITDDVGITTLPTFEGETPPGHAAIGGWNLYLNPHSKNMGAALTFIKWMTGKQAQMIMATKGGEIPSNVQVLQDPTAQQANPAYPIAAKNTLVGRPSRTPAYSAVSHAIYSNINAALAGTASPKGALQDAAKQINSALSGGL